MPWGGSAVTVSFFVLSNLICGSRVADFLCRLSAPLMRLFSLPACCGGVFALGILSGFPVGAEGSSALVLSGGCSKAQGERLLALSDHPSPAFVISAVGSGLFGSAAVGWGLFLCQTVSAFFAGIVTAYIYKEDSPAVLPVKVVIKKPFPLLFTESVVNAFFSVLKVCSFVIFFVMLTEIPVRIGAFGGNSSAEIFFSGFLELTSGFRCLSRLSLPTAFALSGMFLGWSGLSVLCQVAVFALKGGLSLRPYWFSRFFQSLFCGVLTFCCSFLFLS